MHIAGPFFIEDGILSHYQTWLAIAAALQLNVSYLKKKAENLATHEDIDKVAQVRPGQYVRLHCARPRLP